VVLVVLPASFQLARRACTRGAPPHEMHGAVVKPFTLTYRQRVCPFGMAVSKIHSETTTQSALKGRAWLATGITFRGCSATESFGAGFPEMAAEKETTRRPAGRAV
jgi:hypothetical protein